MIQVSWLVFLILIFVAIFVILGMNLMPGLITQVVESVILELNILSVGILLSTKRIYTQPWSASVLMRGMRVFIRFPNDPLPTTPFPVAGRVATLHSYDNVNHSGRPWFVSAALLACIHHHQIHDRH